MTLRRHKDGSYCQVDDEAKCGKAHLLQPNVVPSMSLPEQTVYGATFAIVFDREVQSRKRPMIGCTQIAHEAARIAVDAFRGT